MRSDLLTVQEAAEIVGVSTSTFKRMCESVPIQLIRTPGGHRRIDRMELDRVAKRYLAASHSSLAETTMPLELDADRVLQSLLRGRPYEVAKLFSRWIGDPVGLMAAIDDCFVVALWKIGELWRGNQIDVYQEHLCTSATLTAIDIIRQYLPEVVEHRFVAVGGALAPCVETIPSKLVAMCLELMGAQAIDLGGSVPADSMAKAARELNAQVIWITHTHVADRENLIASHRIVHEQISPGTQIIVGGGGMSPALRRALPWCEYFETFSQLVKSELSGMHSQTRRVGAQHRGAST